MKKLNDTQKARLVRIVARYALYAVSVASVALILSGIFSSTHITVNWVKLLIGGAVLYIVDYTCSWLFRKPVVKKENTDK